MVVVNRKVTIDTSYLAPFDNGTVESYYMIYSIESKFDIRIAASPLKIKAPGSDVSTELEKLKAKYPDAEFILENLVD